MSEYEVSKNSTEANNETYELKPCPFCGNKAEIVTLDLPKEYYVRCFKGCVEQEKTYRQKKAAIRAWNRRQEEEE